MDKDVSLWNTQKTKPISTLVGMMELTVGDFKKSLFEICEKNVF